MILFSLGEKQLITKSYLDQRLGASSYRQFLLTLSQSHWAGAGVFVLIGVISCLLVFLGFWTPLWRWLLVGGGSDLALVLTDGRVGNLFRLGLSFFGISFLLGLLGFGRTWFWVFVPALMYAHFISMPLAWVGLFWCGLGATASLWLDSKDQILRRDLAFLFITTLVSTSALTFLAPWVRALLYYSLDGSFFHQHEARLIFWVLGVVLGLVVLSMSQAVFFHFYFKKFRDQKTPMRWVFGATFFWQIQGRKLHDKLLQLARTRLADYEKIAQDLDELTEKKIPIAVRLRWRNELEELRLFVE
jgi:MFS family permease